MKGTIVMALFLAGCLDTVSTGLEGNPWDLNGRGPVPISVQAVSADRGASVSWAATATITPSPTAWRVVAQPCGGGTNVADSGPITVQPWIDPYISPGGCRSYSVQGLRPEDGTFTRFSLTADVMRPACSAANPENGCEECGSICPDGIAFCKNAECVTWPPSNLTYAVNPAVYTKGIAITPNQPTVTGSDLSYSVNPALPAGLVLNSSTGVITGTPTVIAPLDVYAITAINPGGSTTAAMSIIVNDVPPSLIYSPDFVICTKGSPCASAVPTNSGGVALSYSISQALPVGLSLVSSNGSISGMPMMLSATTSFVVTATNSGGSTNGNVSVTVDDVAPLQLTYSPAYLTCTRGTRCSLTGPSGSGGEVIAYSINPPLPPGLSWSSSNGAIGGTPTTVSATASYTVTATNSGGSTNASVKVTVNDVAPSQLTYSPSALTCAIGTPCSLAAPTNSGGAVVIYSINPAPPAGLSINASTGTISGIPTVLAATTMYTVTATNSGGNTTASVSVAVVCSGAQTNCGGTCVNTSADADACGAACTVCATSVGTGATCQSSVCGCPTGTAVACGSGRCVDQTSDATACGTSCAVCAMSVGTGATCQSGVCGCYGTTVLSGGACVDPNWAEWLLPASPPASYVIGTGTASGTATDTVTGLVWQQAVPTSTRTLEAANSYCTGLSLGGIEAAAWRLPTEIELLSLVDDTRASPSINPTAFPNMSNDTFFWSSSPAVFPAAGAGYYWIVSFDYGYVHYDLTSNSYFVRCVHWGVSFGTLGGMPNTVAPPGRYTINTDTVLDNVTTLTWQRVVAPNATYTWPAAQTYCAGLALGGVAAGSWRLPRKLELESIVNFDAFNPAIDATAFPNTPPSSFWSSSPSVFGAGVYWVATFVSGNNRFDDASGSNSVRCVR